MSKRVPFKNLLLVLLSWIPAVFASGQSSVDSLMSDTTDWKSKTYALYNRGDYDAAYRIWQHFAKEGHLEAMMMLGVMYMNGQGVQVDGEKAFYWFSKAADQPCSEAWGMMAKCYAEGIGVEPDVDSHIFWLRKAAEGGYEAAQTQLGLYYAAGEKCLKRDEKEAFRWFLKAAEKGDIYAQRAVAGYYFYGAEGVKKDLEKARYWAEKMVSNPDYHLLEEVDPSWPGKQEKK